MSTPRRTYWPARWPRQPRPTRIRSVAAPAVSGSIASMRPRRSVPLARGLTRSKKSCGTSGVVIRRATVFSVVVMITIVTVAQGVFSTDIGESAGIFYSLRIVSRNELWSAQASEAAASGTGARRHVGVSALDGGAHRGGGGGGGAQLCRRIQRSDGTHDRGRRRTGTGRISSPDGRGRRPG